jgi:hypothetical protein
VKWGLALHGGRLDGELLWYESDEPPRQVEMPAGETMLTYAETGTVDGSGHRKYVLQDVRARR